MNAPAASPTRSQTDRQEIREAVKALCDRFDDDYWRRLDESHTFPFEFRSAMAEAGWLGITMPEEFGGAGLGIAEAAVLMQTVGNSAGALAACSSIHLNIFGPHPIVVHGTPEQKARMLPPLIRGEEKPCFGVTEPDAGLDTTSITTRAVRDGNRYIVHGRKLWTSTAQHAEKILLLTRTTPLDQCKRRTDGITLFYTDLDRAFVEVREIRKMGRAAVDSNAVFIDGLPVPVEDRIGEEGRGFYYLLDAINPERVLVAAEAVGIGRRALAKASAYAIERKVFGRPIGQNQAIQHPLAQSWMELEAADLMVWKAAELYDSGQPCGAEANAAKYLAAEAAFRACDRAVRTHGGMGYASEYDVERYFREIMVPRIAPVSAEMVLSFIAERVLGMPKSY
ncbi:acyl-CoA dehydrogenase family protein [Zavarzinia sp. CC-PAN008]|uniref:acyl-CoA dehydrogenase family protein n=1 Tax=Zavarzinia sp. CC-PAN008 TaxID=3243332 RepID=UPI003F74864E